jgi:6,7-dimethyl-8-ribityllumazine synthase
VVELQGTPGGFGYRVAIVVSRFNDEVTSGLLRGAMRTLTEAAVRDEDITVLRVPGAFEIPLAARHAAETGRFDAIICLGCVIKGETMHFEYIAGAATQGIADAAAATGVPMAFGVLTALTDEQALARAGDNDDNKGREAALAAVEMATLLREMAHLRREARA